MPIEIHLVSHTHWDREWYRTAEVFRQRLVDLVDELLETPPADGQSFLLDGQAVVLEDYLAVRPQRRDRVAALLQSGRLEAGPWYVLADELIPRAESLVRNLLIGRAILESLGATSPPVLYCPDSFGHPAALPELANGFGLPLIVLWRGYGGRRWPSGDVVKWAAPSGAEAVVFHLPPDGYEFGSSLPADDAGAAERWSRMRSVLAGRSTVGVSLLHNGADHHARQTSLDRATTALSRHVAASGDRLRPGSLRSFADALLQRASAQRLPVVSGELRDSYGYTWTLQGTFATRAAQKRANAVAERALLTAEAWVAASTLAGGPGRVDQMRAAWATLLQAHPHDTLCGTSVDDVARAMDVRLRSATLQADSLATAAVERLLQHDVAVARGAPGRRDLTVIANDVPWTRGGVVLVNDVEKLVDEPVGPGSGHGPGIADVRTAARSTPGRKHEQILSSHVGRGRIESPRHYPDNDIVRSSIVARYVAEQPGLSLRVVDPARSVAPEGPARATRDSIAVGDTRVVFASGEVSLITGSRTIAQLVRFEDRVDEGDLYTPSIRGVATEARMTRQRVVHRGPLVAEIEQEWTFAPPGAKRAAPAAALSIGYRLLANAPLVEMHVIGENRLANHRLRIGIATGLEQAHVFADAAFGAVERKPVEIPEDDRLMETPPATAPLHRYVTLATRTDGVTIHSDGLAEYEAGADGVVWITLVRAVGDLSRNDLPERPGHAGWPEDVPDAQLIGRFEARFAVQTHGAMSTATIDAIEHESGRFLTPLRGFTLRETTTPVDAAGGIELAGTALAASAIKESEDGTAIVLRCVNLSGREQRGEWTLFAPIAEASMARLDETPLEPLEVALVEGRSTIAFTAPPRAVITILARRRAR